MVKFNKAVYSAQTEWNYSASGSLKDNAKGRKLKFSKRNLAGTKRVTILISDKRGDFQEADILYCSEPLSKIIRNSLKEKVSQKDVMAALLNLEIMVNNDDDSRYFLCQPQGDGEMLESFAVNDLTKEEKEYKDLIPVAF